MKRQKNNSKKQPAPTEETPRATNVMNLISGLIVTFFVGVSFYIKGIIPLERAALKEGLTFAMDDAVYHMRLVENTIANFPNRIFYDPFTQYPYGSHLHWGALFEQTIAAISIIAGWIFDGGAPSQATINTVGAFYPAVLGALCVIPAYYIGKELSGRKAGLIASALTAFLPGQFLNRSVLGFTDNHIAEVLFLSIAVMFFIMTLKRSQPLTFDNIRNENFREMKVALIYATLTGISIGIYLLNWTAGIFLVAVFGAYIIIQFVLDHLSGKTSDYLVIISYPVFVIPIVLVSPYVELANGFDSAYYSLLHITVPLFTLLTTAILYTTSKKMKELRINPWTYPAIIIFFIWVGVTIMAIVLPSMYEQAVNSWNIMFNVRTGGQATVSEAQPLTTNTALFYFGLNYYFSFLGLLILGYMAIAKKSAQHTLATVWCIVIMFLMFAQVRFSYYYAINIAVLTAVFGAKCLNLVGWEGYNPNSITSTIKGLKIFPIVILAMLIAIMIFIPADSSIYKISTESTKSGALSVGYFEWHESMAWMRNNTPDTGLDYLGVYERPPKGERYLYPDTAYGVMSWWDYGHIITYWGHRIPNANPFQAGIPSVSTFLTAQNEVDGNKIMDEYGSKYVVTDGFMAYGIQAVFGTWIDRKDIYDTGFSGSGKFTPSEYFLTGIRTNSGVSQVPGLKSFNSMTGKLHIMDTGGLSRYRLIHETPTSPNSLASKVGRNTDIEKEYKYIYNMLFGGNIPVEQSGYVKIFEYVKGAEINGKTTPNTKLITSIDIKTNIGRNFTYTQTTTSNENGVFTLIVPYSTSATASDNITFDTRPVDNYILTDGNVSTRFDVTEQEVRNGGKSWVDWNP